MKAVLLVTAALALSAEMPPPMLRQRDFNQLIDAALSEGAKTAQAGTGTICVQRELEAPFKYSRGAMEATHSSGMPGLRVPRAATANEVQIEKAFAAALALGAAVETRQQIRSVPRQYVPYSARSAAPAKCVIPPIGGSPIPSTVIRLTLTRPVFAHGFAFIDEASACQGLCGSGWLRIFKKQNGRWKQVASRNLFVS